MSGLLIIVFYSLFWLLCSVLARLFVDKEAPKAGLKRTAWFFALAATPFYFYAYDYTRYEVACSEVEIFYPKEKLDVPKVIIVSDTLFGKSLSRSKFDYVVSTSNFRGWLSLYGKPLSKEEISINEAVIFSNGEKVSLSKDEKMAIFDSVKYGVFRLEEGVTSTIGKTSYFIYDFEREIKISNIDSVSKGLSQYQMFRSYLLPYKFDGCRFKESIHELFLNTFKDWSYR